MDEESQSKLDEKSSADVLKLLPPNAVGGVGNFSLVFLRPQMRNVLPLDLEKGGKRTERKLVMIGLIHAGYRAAMAACAYKFHSFFPFAFF